MELYFIITEPPPPHFTHTPSSSPSPSPSPQMKGTTLEDAVVTLKGLMEYRVYIPSWGALYVVPPSVEETKEPTDDQELESCSDSGPARWEGQYNWAPVLAGVSVFAVVAPRVAEEGFESFWASVKDKAGIPSWKYTQTLYMSGDLQWADSLTGLFSALFGERRSLLWLASCVATYLSMTPLLKGEVVTEGKEEEEEEAEKESYVSPSISPNLPPTDREGAVEEEGDSGGKDNCVIIIQAGSVLASQDREGFARKLQEGLGQAMKGYGCREVMLEEKGVLGSPVGGMRRIAHISDGVPEGYTSIRVVYASQHDGGISEDGQFDPSKTLSSHLCYDSVAYVFVPACDYPQELGGKGPEGPADFAHGLAPLLGANVIHTTLTLPKAVRAVLAYRAGEVKETDLAMNPLSLSLYVFFFFYSYKRSLKEK